MQEGPDGTLHPKAFLKSNHGEVMVGSSPLPQLSSWEPGIMDHALAKGHSAAGWMVLARWNFECITEEELEEAELLEMETVNSCKESWEALGPEFESLLGEVLSVQSKSVLGPSFG